MFRAGEGEGLLGARRGAKLMVAFGGIFIAIGWVINAIAPGPIEGTEMTERVNEQVMKLRGWSEEDMHSYALKNIPAGRNTTKAEVFSAILTLFNMPDYVNGTCLEIAGGA